MIKVIGILPTVYYKLRDNGKNYIQKFKCYVSYTQNYKRRFM